MEKVTGLWGAVSKKAAGLTSIVGGLDQRSVRMTADHSSDDESGLASAPDLPRDPRSVLIIEDNRDAATSMQMLLQLLGHEAWVAHTGQDALGLAAARRYDLIFLDIGLPDMDGYEVARRLRDDIGLRDVRLVALSGHGGEEDRRRSRAAGIDAHVVKPIVPDLLAKLLAELAPNRPS